MCSPKNKKMKVNEEKPCSCLSLTGLAQLNKLKKNSFWQTQVITIKITFFFQDLANVLHDSGLVKEEIIKKILKVETFHPFDFGRPSRSPNLEEWELGRLANKIHHKVIVNLAHSFFDDQLTEAQIKNIQSDQRGDVWSASFEILVKWSRKAGDNTRQVKTF